MRNLLIKHHLSVVLCVCFTLKCCAIHRSYWMTSSEHRNLSLFFMTKIYGGRQNVNKMSRDISRHSDEQIEAYSRCNLEHHYISWIIKYWTHSDNWRVHHINTHTHTPAFIKFINWSLYEITQVLSYTCQKMTDHVAPMDQREAKKTQHIMSQHLWVPIYAHRNSHHVWFFGKYPK